jgi:hypothetical protein
VPHFSTNHLQVLGHNNVYITNQDGNIGCPNTAETAKVIDSVPSGIVCARSHKFESPVDDPANAVEGMNCDIGGTNRRSGTSRYEHGSSFCGTYKPPLNDGSSEDGHSVAEEAIVELRDLFKEKWERDASEKEQQRRNSSDVARQKASQAISVEFREKAFTRSLGQNRLEYIERFEAVCQSNAITAEYKSSMIHFKLSDAPLRACNVTIKPHKETYEECIDALKGLFHSPDAAYGTTKFL